MSESGSAQPPVDYYAALGLNPAAPPHALIAQLSHRIAQTPPGSDRHLAEQARAILGDPAKRATYDARLRDPQAPPWTAHELHELALAKPQQSRSTGRGFADKFAAIPRRVLATVAGGLAVLLVVIVTLASCAGGGDYEAVAGDSALPGSKRSGGDLSAECSVQKSTLAKNAGYKKRKLQYPIQLNEAFDLPSEIAAVLTADRTSSIGFLTQYQDKNIGVAVPVPLKRIVAVYTPDGALQSTTEYAAYNDPDEPKPFDLANRTLEGYHYILAKDGVPIPAAAGGNKEHQEYALAILPDAFDNSVWLLLRGGTKLYKGAVYYNSTGKICD